MHEWIAIPIIALNIPLVLVPTILIVKMRLRFRELEHRERMRALELGRAFPVGQPWLTAPRLAFAIGVVMPIGVFLAAVCTHGPRHERVLAAATGVAVSGVVGGSLLARRHFAQEAFPKSSFDDAYDVVGRRG